MAEPAQPEDLFSSELLLFVPALGDYLGRPTHSRRSQEHVGAIVFSRMNRIEQELHDFMIRTVDSTGGLAG